MAITVDDRTAFSDANGNFLLLDPPVGVSIRTVPRDRLPVRPLPPEVSASYVYMFYFGKRGGGMPRQPVPFEAPNDLGLSPGAKATLWYFDGIDQQPLAPHHPRLALQRQVVEVLADGDLHREVRGVVAPPSVRACRRPQRARRRLHAAVARAAVLPEVVEHHEAPLDDRDLLLCSIWPAISRRTPPASRTRAIRRGEVVHHVDDGQRRLGLGAMATLGVAVRPAPASTRLGASGFSEESPKSACSRWVRISLSASSWRWAARASSPRSRLSSR